MYLVYVLVLTWMPFEFSTFYLHRHFQTGIYNWRDIMFVFKLQDMLNNILLFTPLGLILRGLWLRSKSDRSWWSIAKIILSGLAFSALIEGVQFFLDRSPSFLDLTANGLGTACGLVVFDLAVILGLKAYILKHLRTFWILSRCAVFIYALIQAAVMLYPLHLNRFDDWNPDYPLIIGDEGTKDRPWHGDLVMTAVYDHALTGNRIRALFAKKTSDIRKTRTDAAALYDFVEAGGDTVYGRSLNGTPLNLAGSGVRRRDNPKGIRLGPALFSIGKPQAVNERIRRTGQLTVETWMRPDNLTQSGPARIVTVSKNPDKRNWTLGQDERDLIVRVRTRFSGQNGSWVPFRAKSVMDSLKLTHIVFTFHHGVERIYIDGKARPEMIYADIYYLPMMLKIHNCRPAQAGCLFILWFPLGLLLAHLFGEKRIWLALISGLMWTLTIETVFKIAAGQPFHAYFIVLSALASAAGILAASRCLWPVDSGRTETV
jgi:glycopeptide antibiotics resistance protein